MTSKPTECGINSRTHRGAVRGFRTGRTYSNLINRLDKFLSVWSTFYRHNYMLFAEEEA